MIITYFITITNRVLELRDNNINMFEACAFFILPIFCINFIKIQSIKETLENLMNIILIYNKFIYDVIIVITLLFVCFMYLFFTLVTVYFFIDNIKFFLKWISNRYNIEVKDEKIIEKFMKINLDIMFKCKLTNKYIMWCEKHSKYFKLFIIISILLDFVLIITKQLIVMLLELIKYMLTFVIYIYINIKRYILNLFKASLTEFIYKWFRIIIILSIVITYSILQLNQIVIEESVMNIFELVATVILIPLVFEQIGNIKKRKKE